MLLLFVFVSRCVLVVAGVDAVVCFSLLLVLMLLFVPILGWVGCFLLSLVVVAVFVFVVVAVCICR